MYIFIKEREELHNRHKTSKRRQKRFEINWRLAFKHCEGRIELASLQTGEWPEKGNVWLLQEVVSSVAWQGDWMTISNSSTNHIHQMCLFLKQNVHFIFPSIQEYSYNIYTSERSINLNQIIIQAFPQTTKRWMSCERDCSIMCH